MDNEKEIVVIFDEEDRPYVVEVFGTRVVKIINGPVFEEERPAPFTDYGTNPYE